MGQLNAGQLRERVVLRFPGPPTPDGTGGQLAGPETSQSVWARVEPLKETELLALGQMLNGSGYRITIRRGPPVSGKARVSWRGLDLNVQGVRQDADYEFVLLTCFDSGK